MSEIGGALYRKVTGGRSPATEPKTLAQALTTLVKRAGSITAAARVVDMPRKTISAWLAGRAPSKRNAAKVPGVIQAAVAVERRARLSAGREKGFRGSDKLTMVVTQEGRTGRRSIDLGPAYLRDGTMGRVVDAYLAGKPLVELHAAMHRGITDQFYRGLFSRGLPAGGRGEPSAGTGDDDEDQDYDDPDYEPDFFPEDDYHDDDMRGEENHDFDHDSYGISGVVAA